MKGPARLSAGRLDALRREFDELRRQSRGRKTVLTALQRAAGSNADVRLAIPEIAKARDRLKKSRRRLRRIVPTSRGGVRARWLLLRATKEQDLALKHLGRSCQTRDADEVLASLRNAQQHAKAASGAGRAAGQILGERWRI